MAVILQQLRLKRSQSVKAWVDPLRILYAKRRDDWPRYIRRWPLLACPGDWDRFEATQEPYREAELREILIDGRNYRETVRYRNLVSQLESSGRTRFPRCESRAEIDAYFEGLYQLADAMRRDGYRPSNETGAEGDIHVRVDRQGRLLKCGQGTHRLALARILGVSRVLVEVDLVHTYWLSGCLRTSHLTPQEAIRSTIETPQSVYRCD